MNVLQTRFKGSKKKLIEPAKDLITNQFTGRLQPPVIGTLAREVNRNYGNQEKWLTTFKKGADRMVYRHGAH
jgi:hypothetical protein